MSSGCLFLPSARLQKASARVQARLSARLDALSFQGFCPVHAEPRARARKGAGLRKSISVFAYGFCFLACTACTCVFCLLYQRFLACTRLTLGVHFGVHPCFRRAAVYMCVFGRAL